MSLIRTGAKLPVFRIGVKAKNPRKKLGRCHLIAGRDDGMVEGDGHRKASRYKREHVDMPRTS